MYLGDASEMERAGISGFKSGFLALLKVQVPFIFGPDLQASDILRDVIARIIDRDISRPHASGHHPAYPYRSHHFACEDVEQRRVFKISATLPNSL